MKRLMTRLAIGVVSGLLGLMIYSVTETDDKDLTTLQRAVNSDSYKVNYEHSNGVGSIIVKSEGLGNMRLDYNNAERLAADLIKEPGTDQVVIITEVDSIEYFSYRLNQNGTVKFWAKEGYEFSK